jgi:hypothetical protein
MEDMEDVEDMEEVAYSTMLAELDRALQTTPVDWSSVKQIVARQEPSVYALLFDLERLLRVPRVPLDLIRSILIRVEDVSDEDASFEDDSFICPVRVMGCVAAIWYNVLVDRESDPRAYMGRSFKAAEQNTSELLAVTDGASLRSNERIFHAFQLTKLVVLHTWRAGGGRLPYDRTNRPMLSFTSAVIEMKMPPFFSGSR